jgi:hypothetical protein
VSKDVRAREVASLQPQATGRHLHFARMGCLLITTTGELRISAEYPILCQQLKDLGDADWLEVQEADVVQTRHLVRRQSILRVTETLDGPKLPAAARILEA